MEHLEADDKISPATYNNYLSFMVTFFGWIRRRGYIQENVFEGFDRKPKKLTRKKRRLLTDSELSVLFRFLADEKVSGHLSPVLLLLYAAEGDRAAAVL